MTNSSKIKQPVISDKLNKLYDDSEWKPDENLNNYIKDNNNTLRFTGEKKTYLFNYTSEILDDVKNIIKLRGLIKKYKEKENSPIIIIYSVYDITKKYNKIFKYTKKTITYEMKKHLENFLSGFSSNFISNFIENKTEDIEVLKNITCEIIDYYMSDDNNSDSIYDAIIKYLETELKKKYLFDTCLSLITNYCNNNNIIDKRKYYIYIIIKSSFEYIFVSNKLLNNLSECENYLFVNYGKNILEGSEKLVSEFECYFDCEAHIIADKYIYNNLDKILNKRYYVINDEYFTYSYNKLDQVITSLVKSDIEKEENNNLIWNKHLSNKYRIEKDDYPSWNKLYKQLYKILKKKYKHFNIPLDDSYEFLLYSHLYISYAIENSSISCATKSKYFGALRHYFIERSKKFIGTEYYKREHYYKCKETELLKGEYNILHDIKCSNIIDCLPDNASFINIQNNAFNIDDYLFINNCENSTYLQKIIKLIDMTTFNKDIGFIYIILTKKTKRYIPKNGTVLLFKIGKTENFINRMTNYGDDLDILYINFCYKNLNIIESNILRTLENNSNFEQQLNLYGREYFIGSPELANQIVIENIKKYAHPGERSDVLNRTWLGKNIDEFNCVKYNESGSILVNKDINIDKYTKFYEDTMKVILDDDSDNQSESNRGIKENTYDKVKKIHPDQFTIQRRNYILKINNKDFEPSDKYLDIYKIKKTADRIYY